MNPSSPPPSAPPPSALRGSSSRSGWAVAVAAVVVIAAVLGGVWWRLRPVAVPPPEAAPPGVAPSEAAPAPPVASSQELAQSDTRVRQLVGLLSPAPELAPWLASTQDLVRRFASAVSVLAEGESPRAALSFMAPGAPFRVVSREGHTYVDPASYARYDGVARVLTTLDTNTSAVTYKALKPLIDAAYQEISRPGQRFDQTLANAIQRLVDTPVPEGDLEVVDTRGVNYTYVAPELERLGAAQKHLLRMGPAHARAVQAKLRELRDALGLPPATPAAPATP